MLRYLIRDEEIQLHIFLAGFVAVIVFIFFSFAREKHP